MRRREMFFAALAAALALTAFATPDPEPTVTELVKRAVTERKNDIRPCDGLWIRQCAAGECWAPKKPAPQCVPSADLTEPRPMPPHILTLPL